MKTFKKRTTLVVVITFLKFTVLAQFPAAKDHPIELLSDTTSTSITYELGTVKFYFRKSTLLKQLKKRLSEKIYQDMRKRGSLDTNYYLLLNKLKTIHGESFHITNDSLSFDSKTGQIESRISQNYYKLGLNELLPYLLVNGQFAILDHRTNILVKDVLIKQVETLDFLGYRQITTLSYPEGKFLFSIQNRQSNDGNDLITTF